MKKIIVLMFLLFIVLLHFDTKAATAKKIDLKTKEGQINLVFIKLDGSISLLIDKVDNSKLFLIKEKSTDGLNKILDIFDIKPKIMRLEGTSGYIDDIYITHGEYYTLKINDYNLCIAENKKEIKNCDFIYLLDLKEDFLVDEKTSVVFYDENINDDYLMTVNESWIDSHIVSIDSFTVLKLNEEGYNIFVIPLANQ